MHERGENRICVQDNPGGMVKGGNTKDWKKLVMIPIHKNGRLPTVVILELACDWQG